VPRKYFWADDVGGVLRPGDRELHVGLEEGVGAVLPVGDPGLAALPLDGVVRVHPGLGEEPADPDPDLLRRHRHVRVVPSPVVAGCCVVPARRAKGPLAEMPAPSMPTNHKI